MASGLADRWGGGDLASVWAQGTERVRRLMAIMNTIVTRKCIATDQKGGPEASTQLRLRETGVGLGAYASLLPLLAFCKLA